jgi:hypothetical protein
MAFDIEKYRPDYGVSLEDNRGVYLQFEKNVRWVLGNYEQELFKHVAAMVESEPTPISPMVLAEKIRTMKGIV